MLIDKDKQVDLKPIVTAMKNELAKKGLTIAPLPSPLPEIKKHITRLFNLLEDNRDKIYKGWEVLLLLNVLSHYRVSNEELYNE